MIPELSASAIIALHDHWTRSWHKTPPEIADSEPDTLLEVLRRNHFYNFELWHEEDKARVPDAPDSAIAEVKRTIDRINQWRNDMMEACDNILLKALVYEGLPRPGATLHSESFGLMIDRLSVLSLKMYHTREEIERPDAPEGHAVQNRKRLTVLEEQRCDLAGAMDEVWREVLAGRRRFKVYRQLKMYNEPALNPRVYGAKG